MSNPGTLSTDGKTAWGEKVSYVIIVVGLALVWAGMVQGSYVLATVGTVVAVLGAFLQTFVLRRKDPSQEPRTGHPTILAEFKPSKFGQIAPLALVSVIAVGVIVWKTSTEIAELKLERSELFANVERLEEEQSALAKLGREQQQTIEGQVQEVMALNRQVADLELLVTADKKALVQERDKVEEALSAATVDLEIAKSEISELAEKHGRSLDLKEEELRQRQRKIAELQEIIDEERAKPDAPPGVALVALLKKVPEFDVSLTYGGVGAFIHERGEPAKALSYYKTLRSIAQEQGYDAGLAVAYQNVAIAAQLTGDLEEIKVAEIDYEKGQELADKIGRPQEKLLTSYNKLGILGRVQSLIQSEEGRWAAEKFYKEAFNEADAAKYDWGMASAKMNLGVISQMRGELPQADKLYQEALELFKDGPYKIGMAMVYENLAVLSDARQQHPQAEDHRSKARQLIVELGQ